MKQKLLNKFIQKKNMTKKRLKKSHKMNIRNHEFIISHTKILTTNPKKINKNLNYEKKHISK